MLQSARYCYRVGLYQDCMINCMACTMLTLRKPCNIAYKPIDLLRHVDLGHIHGDPGLVCTKEEWHRKDRSSWHWLSEDARRLSFLKMVFVSKLSKKINNLDLDLSNGPMWNINMPIENACNFLIRWQWYCSLYLSQFTRSMVLFALSVTVYEINDTVRSICHSLRD